MRCRITSNIQLDHLLLDLGDQHAEQVGHRQPKEDMDIVREPMAKAAFQTRIDREGKGQRSQDGQDDQVERPHGVDTKPRRFEERLQDLGHPASPKY